MTSVLALKPQEASPAQGTMALVRDPDLIKRISDAAPFLRDTIARSCEQEQARRDAIASMSGTKRRRIATAELLGEEKGVQRDDLRQIHSVLAICSLPYTRQDISIREWERKQGRMNLLVTAGKIMGPDGKWVTQPLPYGSRARLLLLHTCSEALRQKSATIEIEDSLSGFMRAMGLKVTGGKNGTITAFKQQIYALAACKMQIGFRNDNGPTKQVSTQPFSSLDVWFAKSPDEEQQWPSSLTFAKEFYETLSKHALPVNMHAVRAFSSSARKLDLLFWLGYRINNADGTLNISWEAMQDQFGWGYARADNFRRDFIREITEIKEVFPKLPVKFTDTMISIGAGTSEILAIPHKGRKS